MQQNQQKTPDWFQYLGVALALSSGCFNGAALVLQKKGLIDTAQEMNETGNEHAYLKSKIWWIGITCMVIAEISNFGAYSFSPAIIVTPLGAVSVVVSAILSIMFLGEKINFSGGCGIVLCIIGSTIIVLHGPPTTQTETIPEFISYVAHPFFIVYTVLCGILTYYLIVKIGPKYGSTQPVVYLLINAIAGAYLVNSAQGFGSSAVYSFRNWNSDNQFLRWEMYPLFAFMILDAVMQINYLNKSLQHFSTSIVTPVSYVFFSSVTIITSAILYRGFNVSGPVAGVSIILGFMVIVIGVSLLFQYNLKLNKLAQMQARQDPENLTVSELSIVHLQNINEPETDKNPISLMVETFPPGNVRRSYSAPNKPKFFSFFSSGSQRNVKSYPGTASRASTLPRAARESQAQDTQILDRPEVESIEENIPERERPESSGQGLDRNDTKVSLSEE